MDNELLLYDRIQVIQTANQKYRPFFGIGIVYRVVKGDKQDLVNYFGESNIGE